MKNKIKKLMNRALRKEEGFTLVEIIVVIVIMAILAAIAIPSVLGYINDANDAKYVAEARSIYLACQVEEAMYNTADLTTYVHAGEGTAGDTIEANVVTRLSLDTGTNISVGTITYTADDAGTADNEEKYVITFTASDGTSQSATVEPNGEITIA